MYKDNNGKIFLKCFYLLLVRILDHGIKHLSFSTLFLLINPINIEVT